MTTRLLRTSCALLLCLPILSACGKGTDASVNVLAVNYTEKEFSYRLEDPSNPKNTAAGELVDSYSAGGIQCCFNLPRQWHPGIKVRIVTTQWDLPPPPNDDLKNLKEVRNSVDVEVPQYVDGKPGDLWVVKNGDSSFGVVSSSYQPDHPKWPGAVKGWPVPSVDYRRKLWDQQVQHEVDGVKLYENFLAELRQDPVKSATAAWSYKKQHEASFYNGEPFSKNAPPVNTDWYRKVKAASEFLDTFTGPTDPKFIEWLRQDYERSLKDSRARLQKVQESRP